MDDLAFQMFGDAAARPTSRRALAAQRRALRNRHRKTTASALGVAGILLGGAATLVVTGAATAGERTDGPQPSLVSTHVVALSDGRAVTCATPTASAPALDCNWAHTHPTDPSSPTSTSGIVEAFAGDVLCLVLTDEAGVALSCDWQGQAS